jgi:hypothetical protein
MSLFRVIGTALFIGGVIMLIFGIAATQKTGEKIVDALTGHYTDATMWYIIGGVILIVGGIGLTRVRRK